jgi:hypothetical protein
MSTIPVAVKNILSSYLFLSFHPHREKYSHPIGILGDLQVSQAEWEVP